jgi:hypothetical protein
VYGVGVDVPSVDPGKNVIFEAHQTLSGAQIFGIENLKLEKDVLPGKWPTEALKGQMPPFVTLLNGFLGYDQPVFRMVCYIPGAGGRIL